MRRILAMAYLALWGVLGGCATIAPPRAAVPETLVEAARPLDLPDVRFFGDAAVKDLPRLVAEVAPQIRARANGLSRRGGTPIESILALSGGADDGAFGAGLLVGWTKSGSRPNFAIVTGVSAGALIAPFAFLGPAYDDRLSRIFTTYDRPDIIQTSFISGLLGGAAIADGAPLEHLIATYADERMLDQIGHERAKGRLLLIGTTNLDAQRPVFWDIGKIAQSRHPARLTLFRKVLQASASVQGVFPPVRFPVRANGRLYDELHVDGGATKEVFLAPAQFQFSQIDRISGIKTRRRVYIIRNGRVHPEFKAVDEKTFAIAGRSMQTLLKYQGIGDLYRIYFQAKRDGLDYNLISIPRTFNADYPGPFDRRYMQALYAEGYRLGTSRNIPWQKAPPGLVAAR